MNQEDSISTRTENLQYILCCKGYNSVKELSDEELVMLEESKSLLNADPEILELSRKYFIDNVSPNSIERDTVHYYLLNNETKEDSAIFLYESDNEHSFKALVHSNEENAIIRIGEDDIPHFRGITENQFSFLKKLGIRSITLSFKISEIYFNNRSIMLNDANIINGSGSKKELKEMGLLLGAFGALILVNNMKK